MFARILKSRKKYGTYEYLVISESVRNANGKSTTRNIANLGNINNFSKSKVKKIIKGLARIFEIDDYSDAANMNVTEVLEHGSILVWRKIWELLNLTETIEKSIGKSESRIKLDAVKYIEMMVINRCVSPQSKLAASRWLETTSYKIMKDYSTVKTDVEYFYRSMDYLLKAKDEIELCIYHQLQTLFSINVKLTFYDITSTYFYSDSCSISAKGHSRDTRPDLEQIVIGVVTSYEGYPIKHYVFKGNTKDETTVSEVVKGLKENYNIQETVFVGDRGMITKLNIQEILDKDFDYIMGVKHKQEEKAKIFFTDDNFFFENTITYNGLKVADRDLAVKNFIIWKITTLLNNSGIYPDGKNLNSFFDKIRLLSNSDVKVYYKNFKVEIEKIVNPENNKELCRKIFSVIKKYENKYDDHTRFIICLNESRKKHSQSKRTEKLKAFEDELIKIFALKNKSDKSINYDRKINKLFEGYNRQYKKFFIFTQGENENTTGYKNDNDTLKYEKRFDGVFIITSNRYDLTPAEIIKSYKNLQEVESLFDDLKHFVDVRPVRHWLTERVEAHVFICILALLLKRVFEIEFLKGKSVTEPLEEIAKSKIVRVKMPKLSNPDEYCEFPKITDLTPGQKKYFKMLRIKNPMDIGNFVW